MMRLLYNTLVILGAINLVLSCIGLILGVILLDVSVFVASLSIFISGLILIWLGTVGLNVMEILELLKEERLPPEPKQRSWQEYHESIATSRTP